MQLTSQLCQLFLTLSICTSSDAYGPRAEFPAFFIYNRVLLGWFYSEIIIGFLGAFAPKSPIFAIYPEIQVILVGGYD